MNKEDLQLAFWDVVVECLVEIHGRDFEKANQLVHSFRSNLRQTRKEVQGHAIILVYHEEPFYVACNLADNEQSRSEFNAKYEKILERHGLTPQPPGKGGSL